MGTKQKVKRIDAATWERIDAARKIFTDAIEWPNGEGFTPCTREYAQLMDERDALLPEWSNLDDLSAEDYERWNVLDDRLHRLMAEGHIGKSVRY